MATLSEADRTRVWRGLMRLARDHHVAGPSILKDDLRDAVDAADDSLDGYTSTFASDLQANASTFATNTTAEQKAILAAALTAMRVSPSFARRLLGEVD